jgi:hypothetical protein
MNVVDKDNKKRAGVYRRTKSGPLPNEETRMLTSKSNRTKKHGNKRKG